MPLTVLLDVDGTLVDTNYQHALAWYRAFLKLGLQPPIWRIHRHVGMGGDHLVAAIAGDRVEKEKGEAIRDAEKGLYEEMIDEVRPFEGARELIIDLKEREHSVVLSSSAKAEELDHYLELLEVRDVVDAWTDSSDVDATKPEPDLVRAALEKGDGKAGVMVGDSVWDCEAAGRAGLKTIAVLTGGFSRQELLDVGAMAVHESIDDLRRHLDEPPFV